MRKYASRNIRKYWLWIVVTLLILSILVGGGLFILTRAPGVASNAPGGIPANITGLHVVGNSIENSSGQTIQLRGVDRESPEYACTQGWGFGHGPFDAANVRAIKAWGVDVVRVPLNEDCWLNINRPVDSQYNKYSSYFGVAYHHFIEDYVSLLNKSGIIAILDLHFAGPGTQLANYQIPMADRDHAPAFWQSVASTFKDNSSVIFDLFNEPYPDNNQNTTAAWTCWRDGGTCSGVHYQAAGMQELVNTIRTTGASNIILLGGVAYAGELSQWLQFEPNDPLHELAASWHSYNYSQCSSSSCWNTDIAPVAAKVPVIAGEIGENDCADGYVDEVMHWLDTHNGSYLAWAWITQTDCKSGPSLLGQNLSDYNGTPSTYGQGIKSYFLAKARTSLASPGAISLPQPIALISVSDCILPDRTARFSLWLRNSIRLSHSYPGSAPPPLEMNFLLPLPLKFINSTP
ncbi:MAG TPA: cellulase family glycosylhydrolase [Ktedonobacteraceae bacterium]|nr:cellulase family glycosylhydrolase [Ktedonobacteraceae bacterium]